MKKTFSLRALFSLLLVISTILCVAQPPGGGGGRPPGGRPPGGRPPFGGGDRQWGQTEGNMPTVKQKKKVREGDTFQVVGVLRDAFCARSDKSRPEGEKDRTRR